MRTAILGAVVILACAIIPSAQAQAPEWEIYGGISYFHLGTASGDNVLALQDGLTTNLNRGSYGWALSGVQNVRSWIGGTFDFSGSYASQTIEGVRFNSSEYPFLFGPQFSMRKIPRLSLFGHPLIGGVHGRANYSGSTGHVSSTAWAYALGGGADVRVANHVAVRMQADWIRSHFAESFARDFQNNLRVSAGLVLTFGNVRN